MIFPLSKTFPHPNNSQEVPCIHTDKDAKNRIRKGLSALLHSFDRHYCDYCWI